MHGFLLSLKSNASAAQRSDASSDHRSVELGSGTTLEYSPRQDVTVSQDGDGTALVLHGYVGGGRAFEPCTDSQRNCELLHRLVRDHRDSNTLPDLVDSLHGSFSLVFVSNQGKRATVITDRLGSRSVYVFRTSSEVHLGSNAVTVAREGSSAAIDLGGLASFLLYGTQVDPKHTYFDGVVNQPEGTIATYSLLESETQKPWYQFNYHPERGRSLSEWAVECARAVERAAARIAKVSPRPLVFFSGGVDSRLCAAAFGAAGAWPVLLTLADANNLETWVAKLGAKTLGLSHDIFYRDSEYYLRTLSRAGETANGSHLWTHGHFSEAFSHWLSDRRVDAAVLGDLGEAFSKLCFTTPDDTSYFDPDAFLEHFDEFPLENYRPSGREGTLALMTRDARDVAVPSLRNRIAARYATLWDAVTDPLARGDLFFRWQRVSCHATFQMFFDVRSAGPERNIMFDREVHGLLERIPASLRSGKRLGARIIRQLHLPVSLVPDANSMLPLAAPAAAHKFMKTARPYFGKVKRRLVSDTYHTTASWPHLPLLMQRDDAWRRRIEELLFQSPLADATFLDQAAVAATWRAFLAGALDRHNDIERLLGLAMTLRALRDPRRAGG